MGKPVMPIAEQISEVKREISLRSYVYPNLIAAGKLTQSEADRRNRRLDAVLDTLLEISQRERLL